MVIRRSDRLTVRVASTTDPQGHTRTFQESRTLTPATTRQLPHPELDEVQLPAVLFALSDPARLELVRGLAAQGPLTVAQCAEMTATGPDVPKSTFSHHLKTLREPRTRPQRARRDGNARSPCGAPRSSNASRDCSQRCWTANRSARRPALGAVGGAGEVLTCAAPRRRSTNTRPATATRSWASACQAAVSGVSTPSTHRTVGAYSAATSDPAAAQMAAAWFARAGHRRRGWR